MAANIGDLITASSFNAIRSRVSKVLAFGDGAEFGYGQTLRSSPKFDNDLITAEDMKNLFDDLMLAAKHQTGNPPTWTYVSGLNAPDAGEIIGVEAADVGVNPATGEVSSEDAVNDLDEGYLDFENAAEQVDVNHLQIGPGALSTSIADISIRTVAWNSEIEHVFTVTWNSATHRRTWANAGGKIRIDANLSEGTSQPGENSLAPPATKDEIWQTMLNATGTTEIGLLGTSSTGSGSVNSNASIIYADRSTKTTWAANGNTTGAQALTILTKSGSGVYSENEYAIKVYEVSENALRFEVRFKDSDAGDSQGGVGSLPVDENVTGTISSTVTLLTPDGFLDMAIPAVTRDVTL